MNAYSFSVEWSIIEPEHGVYDEAALDHYEQLCKALKEAGIKPVVTLHHYTNPTWFSKMGAFAKIENSKRFR